MHDAKPGLETFRVAHEDDLGLNEDASVGDQRGGEPFGLADRCWRAEHRTASLPALDPIRGVRARLRCCCPTPGPEVYRDGYRPSVSPHGNKGSRNIAPFGQFGPAVLLQRRGRATSDFRCPRELDVLLAYVGSRGTPGRVHGLRASLEQDNGGRAPSINIGAGRSSPEQLGGAGERAPASKTVAQARGAAEGWPWPVLS